MSTDHDKWTYRPADHDTQGGGCAGIVIVAAFWAGVAVGVLVSWAWRSL